VSNRAAEEYLQQCSSCNSEELLNFVISQRSSIETYLSAAATLCVSLLLQCFRTFFSVFTQPPVSIFWHSLPFVVVIETKCYLVWIYSGNMIAKWCNTIIWFSGSISPIRLRGCKNRPAPFPGRYRTRRLNQALSVLSLGLGFFWVGVFCC